MACLLRADPPQLMLSSSYPVPSPFNFGAPQTAYAMPEAISRPVRSRASSPGRCPSPGRPSPGRCPSPGPGRPSLGRSSSPGRPSLDPSSSYCNCPTGIYGCWHSPIPSRPSPSASCRHSLSGAPVYESGAERLCASEPAPPAPPACVRLCNVTLTLHVAFKIQAPHGYAVTPASGVLAPKQVIALQVTPSSRPLTNQTIKVCQCPRFVRA